MQNIPAPAARALAAQMQARLKEAVALHQQGQLRQAQALYEDILRRQPEHFDALHLLGVIALQNQNYQSAADLIGQAIALHPGNPAFHSNRGNALKELRQFDAALASYDQALSLKADFAEAHSNRGNVLLSLRLPAAALASYERAIGIRPNYAEAHSNRGTALKELGHLEAAVASYDRAIALMPGYAEAHYNRGTALKALQQLDAAVVSYNQAIALRPDYADACYNRGNALKELHQLDAALSSYDQAIRIKPGHAEAHANRGATLLQLRQLDAAVASYDTAIGIKPDYADAHWNRGLALLLAGDFKSGWDAYEWRWKLQNLELKRQRITQPPWQGKEPLENKTLLLHSEQGLGDTIQFCRYAKVAAEQGARVILEVPETLAGLMKSLDGIREIITTGQQLPGFDLHCPLLSLPRAFKTELDTIPGREAYLRSNGNRLSAWAGKLGPPTRPRIGIAWSGSSGHANDRHRSLTLASLIPHLPAGLDYVSLQREVRDIDRATLQASGIRHFGAGLHDFADTAALCDLMDVIISVDTSVAHLGGALGKTTWVLLPYVPDWRWLLDRDDSPWYASAKLYRQDADRHWEPVLRKVGADLLSVPRGPLTAHNPPAAPPPVPSAGAARCPPGSPAARR